MHPRLRDLLLPGAPLTTARGASAHAGSLAGVRGGAWTLVEVVPLPRGDLRLRFQHDRVGAVESMAYGVLEASVGCLPAPEDARARVAAVLAASEAEPRGGWVDLAGPVLDALVPSVPEGTLAAWCATALHLDAVTVAYEDRVATVRFAQPRLARGWGRFGELTVHAEVVVEDRAAGADAAGGADDGMWCVAGAEVVRTEGAIRLGFLTAAADTLEVPPDASSLRTRWHDIVRRRLARLLATPDAMIVPWLVQPDAPLAAILERRAADGPVPPLASPRAPHRAQLARAAASLTRAGETTWSLGDWSVEADLPGGELRLARDGRVARVLVRHPWDTARFGALDADAAGAVLLARWLRDVLLAAGQDATVSWHPFDPDYPDQRAPLVTLTVTQWLAMEPPDADIEPVLDWRVQGLVVGEEPWAAWEGAATDEVLAQVALRDAFVGAWRAGAVD